MSQKTILAAGMLLYRFPSEGGIEILVGERSKKPWLGYDQVVFGGLCELTDQTPLGTAQREAREETGGDLVVRMQHIFPIGAFGPESHHYRLWIDRGEHLTLVKTNQSVSRDDKFLWVVFAGMVVEGEARDTREVVNFRWVEPLEYIAQGANLAFDQALALKAFLDLRRHEELFQNPRIANFLGITAT